jgi:hypothetical protein
MPFELFSRKPDKGQALPGGWRRAGEGDVSGLLTRGGASPEAIAAAAAGIGTDFPPTLAAFLERADAAEGWVGGEYLAVWPTAEIADLNRVARVAEFAPRLVAFATDGGGEGYFFDRDTGDFFRAPMIGLGHIEAEVAAPTFDGLLRWIAARTPAHETPPVADTSRFGQVIHEVKPILFGGSPTDPANKVLLPLAKYAEVVAWWNGVVRATEAGTPERQQP